MSIERWLRGYVQFSVPEEKAREMFEVLYHRGISYGHRRIEGGYSVRVRQDEYQLLQKSVPQLFEEENPKAFGLPALLQSAFLRLGIPIGVLCCALVYLFLTSFVWEIRIEGMEGYGTEALMGELERQGLKEGAFFPKLDLDSICAHIMAESAQVSFINMTRRGTVIYAACIPYEEHPNPIFTKDGQGINLVASADAVIEEIIIEEGRPVIVKGAVVKKGDLLVSGIYETAVGTKLVRASGTVKGRLSQRIEIFVPFEQTVETAVEHETVSCSIEILGYDLRLFTKIGTDTEESLQHKERVYLFDRIRLPVVLKKSSILHTDSVKVHLSERDAMERAYLQLKNELTLLLSDADLVSKQVEGRFLDTGYELICYVTYVENIAEGLAFYYD